jgi:DNA-binding transcriptional MerR regulator
MYSATQVAKLFSTVRETIRNWAIEFENELSPTANPGPGRQRAFSDSDLEIIALIASMKREGKLYSDIHAALANNQRGSVPDRSALVPADTPRPTQLQARVNFLEAQLSAALESSQRDKAQIELLTRQLNEAQAKIDRLNREIGRLERDMD